MEGGSRATGRPGKPRRERAACQLDRTWGRQYSFCPPAVARWESGYPEDCKSLHAGSIPARASSRRRPPTCRSVTAVSSSPSTLCSMKQVSGRTRASDVMSGSALTCRRKKGGWPRRPRAVKALLGHRQKQAVPAIADSAEEKRAGSNGRKPARHTLPERRLRFAKSVVNHLPPPWSSIRRGQADHRPGQALLCPVSAH